MSRIRAALGLERRSYENPAVPLTARALLERLGRRDTEAGVLVSEGTALTFSAVFACVQILARGVAILPLRWYERQADGSKRPATEQLQDTLLHVAPNREQTPAVFRETLQGHVGLGGNCYARVLFDGAGRPRELVGLDPGNTSAERTLGDEELRYVTWWKDKPYTVLEPEEVLHVPGLGFDGVTGYSPVGLARQGIGVALAAEQFTGRLFQNGAWLSGVFEHPNKLGDDAHKHLKDSLTNEHKGAVNAFKPLVLEEGLKWHQATMPTEDAVFLALRKFQRREVASMYQVPPHMIADLEGGASFSSIEQMSLDFVMFTLAIWLVKWEQEATRKLGGGGRFFAEFNVDALLRGTTLDRYNAHKLGREAGFLNVDEIRARENLPPLPNGAGKRYLEPLNMAPAGSPPASRVPEPRGVREALAAAQRQLLVEACGRLTRMHADRVRRQAKGDTAAFRSWAEGFYREQVEHGLAQLATPALCVAAACTVDVPQEKLQRALQPAVRDVLLQEAQLVPRELAEAHAAGRLEELLEEGVRRRPEAVAERVLRAIVGAVQLTA